VADLVALEGWAKPETRKVRAVKACHDFDAEALQELVRYYMAFESRKQARTSPQTLRAYASGLRVFLAFCRPDPERSPDVAPLRATREDLKRFVYQRQLSVAPESVRLNLAAVRAFYRALLWAGAVEKSPAENVTAPPDPRPREDRRGAVPVADYKLMLDVVSARDTAPAVRARDLSLLRLLGDQGLRNMEVCRLRIDDLDTRRQTLRIRAGKGGKSATMPLTQPTHRALTAWLEHHPVANGALFVNLSARTRRTLLHAPMSSEALRGVLSGLYRAAGLTDQGAHALRHTSAVRLYLKTRDLHMVARHLRHSDISTTAIYAKMAQDDLRAALDTLDD
jgi:integrase/recombinase XerC